MKNKASENTSYNGIKIVNSINFTVPQTKLFVNKIILIVIAFFGIFGSILSFFSMFKTNVNILTVGYFTFLFFAVFTILFNLPKKFQLVNIPIFALYIFLLYKSWQKFIIGYKLLFNQAYLTIYPNAGKYFNLRTNNIEYAELFLAFIIFLITALICYSVYIRPNFLLSFLATFPIIETGLYFGKSPAVIYAFMVIIFWIAQLVSSSCGYYQNIKKNHSGFVRKNNSFIAKPGIKFKTAGFSIAVMAVICSIIFALTAILSSLTDYKRSDNINTLRSDLKIAANEFSFENFGESIEKFSASLGFGKNKFYSHKLGNIGSVRFKNTSEITVQTSDKFDDNIYLKGFTGAVYAEDEWEELPEEVYNENQEIFDKFENAKTSPQDMLTSYFFNRYNADLIDMNIKSEYKNEKYNYTPYISFPLGNINYVNDTYAELENKNDYSFKVNKVQINLSNFTDILSGLNYSINDYDFHNDYYDFVTQNYLDVPYSSELQEVYDQIIKNNFSHVEQDAYKRLESIREILAENAEYTLNPGKTPDNEDFVNYFLLKNHKGYCVHFATAGIILARLSGIPARYAEGYVLRASDFNENNLNDDGTYTIDIKDSRAHAWAEIYFKNLGWVPFEFTPPSAAAFEETTKTTKTTDTNSETTKTSVSRMTKSTASKSVNSNSTNNTTNSSVSISSKKTGSSGNAAFGNLKLKITVLFILAVLSAIAIILLRHFIIIRRRNDIFNNGSPKNKITCAYQSSLKLIEFSGIERNNIQYLEFAEYAKVKLPDILENDDFKVITEIMLKAQMSDITPTESEINMSIDFYRKLYLKIYENNNIIKKILIKFLKNL